MSFNPTIDVGDIIKFVCVLATSLWFISKMSGRLDLVTAEIKSLKEIIAGQSEQLAEFSKAIIQLARQDERLDAIDRRVEDLRRGQGFIERDVDGEYMRTGKVR